MNQAQAKIKILWWEKTVEWQFAFSALGHQDLVAAPLDGNPESGGADAQLSTPEGFALVEFKKKVSDCHGETELKKYAMGRPIPAEMDSYSFYQRCFEAAKKKLSGEAAGSAHFFVYGTALGVVKVGEASGNGLVLEAAKYWDCQAFEDSSPIKVIKDAVAGKVDFDSYVVNLAAERGYKKGRTSGGASVLGFKDGVITVMDIMDYVREKKLRLRTPKEASKEASKDVSKKKMPRKN